MLNFAMKIPALVVTTSVAVDVSIAFRSSFARAVQSFGDMKREMTGEA